MTTLRVDAPVFFPFQPSNTLTPSVGETHPDVVPSALSTRRSSNSRRGRRQRSRRTRRTTPLEDTTAANDDDGDDDSLQRPSSSNSKTSSGNVTSKATVGKKGRPRRNHRQRKRNTKKDRRNESRNHRASDDEATKGRPFLEPALFPALTMTNATPSSVDKKPIVLPQENSVWATTTTTTTSIESTAAMIMRAPAASNNQEDHDHPWLGEKRVNGLDLLPTTRRTGNTTAMRNIVGTFDMETQTNAQSVGDELLDRDDSSNHAASKVALLSSIENYVPPCADETTSSRHDDGDNVLRRRRRRGCVKNISKLRDRWWDLMQQHNQKIQEEQQRHEEAALLRQENECYRAQQEPVSHTRLIPNDPTEGDETQRKCVSFESICSEHSSNERLSIHECIRKGDTEALERLLCSDDCGNSTHPDCDPDSTSMSPLQLAIHLNRPQSVRILCRALERKTRPQKESAASENTSLIGYDTGDDSLPPLLMAAKQRRDECLQIFLSTFGTTSLLTTRDSKGNTAFHYCCRGTDTDTAAPGPSTFNLLLNCAVTSSATSKTSSSIMFKVLSSKNDAQQTPLHVACAEGRADIVDFLLNQSTGNFSLLSKILDLKDAKGQTPLLAAVAAGSTGIVMTFLMWRGNNHSSKQRPPSQPQSASFSGSRVGLMRNPTKKRAPCPLMWAVRSNNVEMVSLLLEFNSPSHGSGYNLNEAVYYAASSNVNETIIYVLVEAGANPCAVRDESKNDGQSSARRYLPASVPRSSVAAAASLHDHTRLTALLDSYKQYLDRIRYCRRCDPKLQKQPESFFANMESAEDAERREAMRDSLVVSLYHIWLGLSSSEIPTSSFITCALALYRRGAFPTDADIGRLKASFADVKLVPFAAEMYPSASSSLPQYQSTFPRHVPPFKNEKGKDQAIHYYSRIMLQLPWCNFESSSCECSWITSHLDDPHTTAESFPEPDVVLVCEDEFEYLVHGDIIARGSDKFAAAIRFNSMSQDPAYSDSPTALSPFKMKVDMTGKVCRWMLEHIYHGSITGGLSEHSDECCEELLELLLVAEEFICKSLLQECEMRMLSADSCYRCFCCYCCVRPEERVHTKKKPGIVECSFQVSGPSIIDAELLLDVLAVVQHVSISCSENDYTLLLTDSDSRSKPEQPHPWSSTKPTNCIVRGPLEALREVVVHLALRNFDGVVKSSAFATHFADESAGKIGLWHGEQMLLRMSIEDLSTFCKSKSRALPNDTASQSRSLAVDQKFGQMQTEMASDL